MHGALQSLCELYGTLGVDLGDLGPATAGPKGVPKDDFKGQIVLAPPSAIADRWARRLPDPVVCMASGWMRVRQRAKQRGVELPLIISDHADWDELLDTLDDVGAPGSLDHTWPRRSSDACRRCQGLSRAGPLHARV